MATTRVNISIDPTYITNVLIPEIDQITFYTEDGGKSSSLNTFSFAGGQSTYSFGLFQYDVGANVKTQNFLLNLGFTPAQISLLKGNGGLTSDQLATLNAQLATALTTPSGQAAIQAYNNQWAADLVSQLQTALATIGSINPSIADQIYSSPELQLRLIDYANQFNGLTPTGPMATWLEGLPPNTTLTGGMIQNYIMNTPQGLKYPIPETTRENALNSQLSMLVAGMPVVDLARGSATTTAMNNTMIEMGSGAGVNLTGNGDIVVMSTTSNASVNGNNDSVLCGANSVAASGVGAFTCTNGSLSTTMSNGTLNVSQGATIGIVGQGNSINLGNGSKASLTSTGSNTVTCGSETTVVTGNATESCSNGALTVSESAAGGSIEVTSGQGISVTGTSDSIIFDADTSGTIAGSKDAVSIGQGASVTVTGNSDSVNTAAGVTGDSLIVSGASDTVNFGSAGNSVTFNNSVEAFVGNGDQVAFDGWGKSSVSGTGNTILIAANSVGAQTLSISGSNNVVDANDLGNQLSFNGSSNVLNGSGQSVTEGQNASLTIAGNNESLTSVLSGALATLYGSNETVNLSAGAAVALYGSENVTGSGASVTLAQSGNLTLSGSSDSLFASAATNNSNITINGSSVTASIAGQGNTLMFSGSGEALSFGGGNNTVNLAGSSDVLHDSSAGNTFTFAGSAETIYGSNEIIWLDPNLSVNPTSSFLVIGNNDLMETVAGETGTTTTFYGSGDLTNFASPGNSAIYYPAGSYAGNSDVGTVPEDRLSRAMTDFVVFGNSTNSSDLRPVSPSESAHMVAARSLF